MALPILALLSSISLFALPRYSSAKCTSNGLFYLYGVLVTEAQPEWGRRGHGPSRKKLVKIFRWCFISISTVRKQTEGTVGLM